MGNRHNVTDIVRISKCEAQVQLDRKHGEKVDRYTRDRRSEGIRFHRKMETSSDRRCYVATVLFGMDSPEVRKLRIFRDNVLMMSAAGRLFCRVYYRTSPWVIRVSPAYISAPARRLLKWICTGLPEA